MKITSLDGFGIAIEGSSNFFHVVTRKLRLKF